MPVSTELRYPGLGSIRKIISSDSSVTIFCLFIWWQEYQCVHISQYDNWKFQVLQANILLVSLLSYPTSPHLAPIPWGKMPIFMAVFLPVNTQSVSRLYRDIYTVV